MISINISFRAKKTIDITDVSVVIVTDIQDNISGSLIIINLYFTVCTKKWTESFMHYQQMKITGSWKL